MEINTQISGNAFLNPTYTLPQIGTYSPGTNDEVWSFSSATAGVIFDKNIFDPISGLVNTTITLDNGATVSFDVNVAGFSDPEIARAFCEQLHLLVLLLPLGKTLLQVIDWYQQVVRPATSDALNMRIVNTFDPFGLPYINND